MEHPDDGKQKPTHALSSMRFILSYMCVYSDGWGYYYFLLFVCVAFSFWVLAAMLFFPSHLVASCLNDLFSSFITHGCICDAYVVWYLILLLCVKQLDRLPTGHTLPTTHMHTPLILMPPHVCTATHKVNSATDIKQHGSPFTSSPTRHCLTILCLGKSLLLLLLLFVFLLPIHLLSLQSIHSFRMGEKERGRHISFLPFPSLLFAPSNRLYTLTRPCLFRSSSCHSHSLLLMLRRSINKVVLMVMLVVKKH